MTFNYWVLWTTFITFLSTTIYLYIKKKNSLAIITWTVYSFSILTSVYYCYSSPFFISDINLSFIPFIYIYCCLLIVIYPISQFRDNTEKVEYKGDRILIRKISIFLIIMLLLPTIENILLAFKNDSTMLVDLYERDSQSAQEMFNRLSFFSRYANKLSFYFFYLIPFFLFVELSNKRKNYYVIVGLLFVLLNMFLNAYNYAARTDAVKISILILTAYLIFKKYLEYKVKRFVKIVSMSLMGGIFFILSAITISRFNNYNIDLDIYSWLSLYTGEGVVNFSNDMWNDKQANMLGDNCFPFFKALLGLDTFKDGFARREYWEPRLGIPNNRFYTFIGDLYADFDWIFTFILILILGYVIKRIVSSLEKKATLSNMIYLYLIISALIFGFTHFMYKVYSDQVALFYAVILGIVLKYRSNTKL